ncbi:glutamate--cysteine ligase [Kitasatospora sp. NPDC050543]|uniref:glutamate--cysteine ligase n=1 Tax=Kitasatospora sp. NPDC050543 TaxID=3364054 RepID=UPI0037B22FDD
MGPAVAQPLTEQSLRFGVEEEFLLIDAVGRRSAARADQVVADAKQVLDERAQSEFYASQVEGCTPPVTTASQLRAELIAMRRALVAAAARAGCSLLASGSAVLPSAHPLPVTDADRYRRIARHVGPVADQLGGEMCGCHVHIGDLTRGEALAVGNRLRPWLPVLQAISTNSPFCEGQDSALASSRSVQYGRWPTVGPAPVLDEEQYERTAEELLSSGVLLDRRMIYWFSRPSEHLPTIEVRIADVNADVNVPVLLASLIRALVHVLLPEARAGAPYPAVARETLCAAHRQAARVGLRGAGLDPVSGNYRPMSDLFARLLDRAAPGLEAAGDLPMANALVERLLKHGTGADRQRAALDRDGSLPAVVDRLVELTAAHDTSPGGPPSTDAPVAGARG